MILGTAIAAFLSWVYLACFNGRFWLPLFEQPAAEPPLWPAVDILVPARNEADVLLRSLRDLLSQNYPGAWRIILIDDQSDDGTGSLATSIALRENKAERLTVITAASKPKGWSGKVAALQEGVAVSTAPYILFTDADIAHPPDSLRRLVACAESKGLALTSRMVKLHCHSTIEKFLIPPFVFFFAMLYPFRRANSTESRVAGAAGGVVLLRRSVLESIGGLARIKSTLIDDCSLARAVKDSGGKIELTLTDSVISLRPYSCIADIWRMIARTAFTQLHYSWLLLFGSVLGLGLLFFAPIFCI